MADPLEIVSPVIPAYASWVSTIDQFWSVLDQHFEFSGSLLLRAARHSRGKTGFRASARATSRNRYLSLSSWIGTVRFVDSIMPITISTALIVMILWAVCVQTSTGRGASILQGQVSLAASSSGGLLAWSLLRRPSTG
jgi:hypothetical protein